MNERPIPPTGWKPTKLKQIVGSIESGVSVNGVAEPARATELGVLKVSAVTSGRFDSSQNKRVAAEEERKRLKYSVRSNSIMMTRSNGSADLVGACVFVEEDHPNLFLSDKLWDLVIADEERDDARWLYYLLCSSPIRQRIVSSSSGSVGMRNVSKTELLGITVGRPPLPEQQKIAAILSTWDRAIELTEKLIAAKQKRKQALMQQLLTGKVRLPGFEKSVWKKCHLSDVAKNSTRRNGSSTDQATVYSVTNSVGMIPMDEGVIGESIERYKTVSHFDFAYNPMRINVGSIAMWHGNEDVLVSPDYVVFQCGPKLDAEYLEHFRKTHYWSHFVTRAGGGSVRVRIYFSDLAAMKLKLPSLEEQKAIAAVLNTQDSEIRLLESKLGTLKQQKKGLMQQLFTGKVRVSVEERVKP